MFARVWRREQSAGEQRAGEQRAGERRAGERRSGVCTLHFPREVLCSYLIRDQVFAGGIALILNVIGCDHVSLVLSDASMHMPPEFDLPVK